MAQFTGVPVMGTNHGGRQDVEEPVNAREFYGSHEQCYRMQLCRDEVTSKPTRTRRVLLHAEGAEIHVTKELARNAVIETLGLIPGIQFAGMVEPPAIGSPCESGGHPSNRDAVGHTVLSDISTAEYRQAQAQLLEQAESVGADAIVTHHHKCHREWSKFSSPQLPVIHYHSLLLETLGITIPDRFRHLWQLNDAEQILAETRPYWEFWNVPQAEAREMVNKFFLPAYGRPVHFCACERDGASSCFAAELRAAANIDSGCKRLGV